MLKSNSQASVGGRSEFPPLGVGTSSARAPSSQPGADRQTNKEKRKDRWTVETDYELVKLYFRDRKVDGVVARGYRKRIYEEFKKLFPQSTFSEQNVCDRLNNIIRHEKYVPPEKVAELKNEVQASLNWEELANLDVDAQEHTFEQNPEPENEAAEVVDPKVRSYLESLESEYTETLGVEFQDLLDSLRGKNPTERPRLNRLRPTRPLQIAVRVLNNKILPEYINDETTFDELNTIIYCAAAVCDSKFNNKKKPRVNQENPPKQAQRSIKTPKHILRLRNRVLETRKDCSRVHEALKGTKSNKLAREIDRITKSYPQHAGHGDDNTNLMEVADTIKQKLAKLNVRLQRYETTIKRKAQNAQFKNNEKLFYRNLNAGNVESNVDLPLPTKEDLQSFWGGIWSTPVEHNRAARWIEKEREKFRNVPEMVWEGIRPLEITKVINKAHNWKSPGLDNIHNYWLKSFTQTHKYLAKFFNSFINDPGSAPGYFARGQTYMLPKDDDTKNPAKYRPITCLNTMYKLMTGVLTDRLYAHLIGNGILAEEQKGCRRGSRGCKEQVLIDSVFAAPNRKLHVAYIDYKKAFDSVPHSWILEVLGIYGVSREFIGFLEAAMEKWETVLVLRLNGSDSVVTDTIRIRRGIYQGDSLSPLLFCVAMNPLSSMLNDLEGPRVCRKWTDSYRLTHLLYMDDIKLYASSDEELRNMLRLTGEFSKDIHMVFGVDKCRIAVTGSLEDSAGEPFLLESGESILGMEDGETYKYLGFLQSRRLEHQQIKDRITKQFVARVTKLVRTKLSGKNLVKALNTYAIPVLTYSFGVIKWTREELRKLRTSMAKILNKYCMHHPKSAVERVSLPRKLGGRGLIDIAHLHDSQVDKLRKFFASRSEVSGLHASVIRADDGHTPLNLRNTAKHKAPISKKEVINSKLGAWGAKSLHGRHYRQLANKTVDREASNAWLTRAGLFPETEGFMLAIQDEVVATKNYKKHIIKDRTVLNDKCRLCRRENENIQHITSGCQMLAGNDYLHRHDQVGQIIHQKLAKKVGLVKDVVPYYKYEPATVLANKEHKIYWNRTIYTDKTVKSNRPDIVFINLKEKTAFFIDIAVPNSHNVDSTVARKITRYADLTHEYKRMYGLKKVETIPLIISATGIVPKCLKGYISKLGLPSGTFLEMQKAAVLNTCRIVRKFMELPEDAHVAM